MITNSNSSTISIINPGAQSSQQQQINFTISIQRLIERDSNGNIEGEPMVIRSTGHFNVSQKYLQNTSNIIYEYLSKLSNGAIINITVSLIYLFFKKFLFSVDLHQVY